MTKNPTKMDDIRARRDIVIRRTVLCLTGRLIHVPEICQTFSLKSQHSVYSETLKHIFKTYLRSDMQTTAVTMYM